MALLAGMDRQAGRQRPSLSSISRLLAHLRIELVAQDRVEPGPGVVPGSKLAKLASGLNQGFLHQVVGTGGVATWWGQQGPGDGIAAISWSRNSSETFICPDFPGQPVASATR